MKNRTRCVTALRGVIARVFQSNRCEAKHAETFGLRSSCEAAVIGLLFLVEHADLLCHLAQRGRVNDLKLCGETLLLYALQREAGDLSRRRLSRTGVARFPLLQGVVV